MCKTIEGNSEDLKKIQVCGKSNKKGEYVCLKIIVLEGIHY